MASGLIFLLFLMLPFLFGAINLARIQWRKWNRTQGPRPAQPVRFPKRKARVRAVRPVSDCGRHFTHLMLTLTGSRGSCRRCAGLDAPGGDDTPPEPEDVLSAAQRIIDEANTRPDQ